MPVNSAPSDAVNRVVSAQGLAVLRAMAASEAREYGRYYDGTPAITPAGEMTVAELVARVRRPCASLDVTRASLSRTLRRLWRAGLVELSSGHQSMTAERQRVLDEIAEHAADPAAAYQGYKGFVKSLGMRDRHGSVEAFMAAQRQRARRNPDLRVSAVQITAAGRARLTVNTNPKLTEATDVPVNFIAGGTVNREAVA